MARSVSDLELMVMKVVGLLYLHLQFQDMVLYLPQEKLLHLLDNVQELLMKRYIVNWDAATLDQLNFLKSVIR